MAMIIAFIREETGQSMTEYALILALVVLIAVVALRQVAVPMMDLLQKAINAFSVEASP